MMKLEYLDNTNEGGTIKDMAGSLVRLYDFNRQESGQLIACILSVVLDERSELDAGQPASYPEIHSFTFQW